jgi:hypothetical protein
MMRFVSGQDQTILNPQWWVLLFASEGGFSGAPSHDRPEQNDKPEVQKTTADQTGGYFRLIAFPASSDGNGEAGRTLKL